MIKIRDCEILDLLPYTFKTPRRRALSKALVKVRAKCYDTMSAVLFWGDIENASPVVLDAMAAELDAPFYSDDMPIEQKRSIIAATFEYNSRIGTMSSITALLTAAFGGGKVSEWYEYGGKPYYFKVEITYLEGIRTDIGNYEYFLKMLEKIKNKRSKLENITTSEKETKHIIVGGIVTKETERITINADTTLTDGLPIYCAEHIGTAIVDKEYFKIAAQKYNNFNEIKDMTYQEMEDKRYVDLLYKED